MASVLEKAFGDLGDAELNANAAALARWLRDAAICCPREGAGSHREARRLPPPRRRRAARPCALVPRRVERFADGDAVFGWKTEACALTGRVCRPGPLPVVPSRATAWVARRTPAPGGCDQPQVQSRAGTRAGDRRLLAASPVSSPSGAASREERGEGTAGVPGQASPRCRGEPVKAVTEARAFAWDSPVPQGSRRKGFRFRYRRSGAVSDPRWGVSRSLLKANSRLPPAQATRSVRSSPRTLGVGSSDTAIELARAGGVERREQPRARGVPYGNRFKRVRATRVDGGRSVSSGEKVEVQRHRPSPAGRGARDASYSVRPPLRSRLQCSDAPRMAATATTARMGPIVRRQSSGEHNEHGHAERQHGTPGHDESNAVRPEQYPAGLASLAEKSIGNGTA